MNLGAIAVIAVGNVVACLAGYWYAKGWSSRSALLGASPSAPARPGGPFPVTMPIEGDMQ